MCNNSLNYRIKPVIAQLPPQHRDIALSPLSYDHALALFNAQKCPIHTLSKGKCAVYTSEDTTPNQSVVATLLYKVEYREVGSAHFCFYSVINVFMRVTHR